MKIKKTKFKLTNNKIKHWDFKGMEGFLLQDSYFFNEYGLYDTRNLIKEFVKKNKKKSITLFDEIEAGDITINFTGLISVTSWLGYTPDKITHITLGYREKITMYKITTSDNGSITTTGKQTILTTEGYKLAEEIKKTDVIIGILGTAKKFKTSNGKKYESIDSIIKQIEQGFNKEGVMEFDKIPTQYRKYLNILGIDSNKELKKQDFITILKKENGKDIVGDFLESIGSKKNLIKRKIKKIEKIEMKNIYIGNITTNLSKNININNFILEQWA